MALTIKERKAVTKEVAKRYQRARKKEKGRILDEFVSLAGYTRCYASCILRNWGRRIVLKFGGSKSVILPKADIPLVCLQGERRQGAKRGRRRIYGKAVVTVLKKIWVICDCICGKRLAPYLQEIVPVLLRCGELDIDKDTEEKLLKISAATVDRLLAPERAKYRLKNRARTKPGTLLKNQIPIRTFADWDEQKPGFVEVDLVGHDGGNPRGEFAQTLDFTDVCTGWTETQAVKNKAQVWVFEAIMDTRRRLPFKLLGIDSDNGGEFINDHLDRFCKKEEITFTRTRPYRKNDNCFVEQKNYSVVRRAVGYYRYSTEKEVRILNELYKSLRPYTNFFQPVMKLIEKTRIGSKVKKRYDKAKTPYRRVLESPHISKGSKERLRKQYSELNPAELKREITHQQNRLWEQVKGNQ